MSSADRLSERNVRDVLSNRQVIDRAGRQGHRRRHRSRRTGGEEGFKGWAAYDPDKRRALLHKIADTIEAHADDIAVLESWDTGQPFRFMSKAAIRGAENFRFFADRASAARDGLSLPSPIIGTSPRACPSAPSA